MKITTELLLALGMVLTVAGCGSDSKDDSQEAVAYVQYYNGSPDSTSTYLSLEDKDYSALNFGQAMQRYSVSTGSNSLKVIGKNAENSEVEFHAQDINLAAGDNHLFILAGDYEQTDFIDIQFTTTALNEKNDNDDKTSYMQVIGAHISKDSDDIGIYIGKKDDGFSGARYLGQIAYKDSTEPEILETGKYVVYLARAGSNEPFFTTAELSLNTKTVYKLVIRPAFGAATAGVKLDVLSGSKEVTSAPDIDEQVQFRVYNGVQQFDVLKAQIKGKSGDDHELQVGKWTISNFTPTRFGDYDVAVSDVASGEMLLNNLLVTYNQSDSKSILLYPDAEQQLRGTVISHNLTPRSYQYEVQLMNLAPGTTGLEVYFVRNDETVETADYKVTKWDFTENLKITLPRDSYTVTVVKRKDNDTLTLLHRQALQLRDNLDFTLVLTPDDTQTWGYRLQAFQ
ncbi:hypothetical protein [Shewanella sp. GXUN23E]|uniref:hypothetical protein n=1 Tax=Shewanella sp. GXUN23E TaxID=3422498 RepID=UPI003D7EA02C